MTKRVYPQPFYADWQHEPHRKEEGLGEVSHNQKQKRDRQ